MSATDVQPQQTSSLAQQTASLLNLPAELRLLIFVLLFAQTLDQDILDRKSCFPLPPILRTNRLLRLEARAAWIAELQAAVRDIPTQILANDSAVQASLDALLPWEWSKAADWEVFYADANLKTGRQTTRTRNLRLLARIRSRMLPKGGPHLVKKPSVEWWGSLTKWQEQA